MDDFEFENLILRAYGLSEEETDEKINEGFCMYQFLDNHMQGLEDIPEAIKDLIERLMPMIVGGESFLTKKKYKGFGTEKNGFTDMICKIEA